MFPGLALNKYTLMLQKLQYVVIHYFIKEEIYKASRGKLSTRIITLLTPQIPPECTKDRQINYLVCKMQHAAMLLCISCHLYR